MYFRELAVLTFVAMASAQSSCTETATTCVGSVKSCGSPTPTAVLTYGGCRGVCTTTAWPEPPCPTEEAPTSSCTLTGTLCEDWIKECGSPVPTATLTYGGCHDPCVKVTYTAPPCPEPTA
ncbi:hypothetical protein F5Y15DRAFT_32328 [Xylariaceae sp. FL0016]|nr:hypothetical protein F5Y15DRAFT_32328 [Xylariaceae sp. FL0016]